MLWVTDLHSLCLQEHWVTRAFPLVEAEARSDMATLHRGLLGKYSFSRARALVFLFSVFVCNLSTGVEPACESLRHAILLPGHLREQQPFSSCKQVELWPSQVGSRV